MKVIRIIFSLLFSVIGILLILFSAFALLRGALEISENSLSDMALLFIAEGLLYFVMGHSAFAIGHTIFREFHYKVFKYIDNVLIRRASLFVSIGLFVLSSGMFVYMYVLVPRDSLPDSPVEQGSGDNATK